MRFTRTLVAALIAAVVYRSLLWSGMSHRRPQNRQLRHRRP